MKNQKEKEKNSTLSANAQKLQEKILGKGKQKPDMRIATLPKDDQAVVVRRKMSRKQRKRAEAESGDRTIADCITFGGNYGIEMAGAKDERKKISARRKQKADAKAEQVIEQNEKSHAQE